MSEQQKENSESDAPADSGGGKPSKFAVFAAILIALVAIIILNLPKGGGNGGGGGGDAGTSQLSEITAALAATENLETDEASERWNKLAEVFPDDSSVLLNRALNAMLIVDLLTKTAIDGTKTEEEKQAARNQIPDAIEVAKATLTDYEKVSGDEVTKTWINAKIDLHSATLIPLMEKSIHRELFKNLTDALSGPLGDDPRSIILGGPLDNLLSQVESPDQGFGTGSNAKAAKAFAKLSDKHPENLLLASQALLLHLDIESVDAIRFLNRTNDLAESIKPVIRKHTEAVGKTPDGLVNSIRTEIEQGNWTDAIIENTPWFNVLNPTEIMRSDRRRVGPHPLDRISFDTIRRLSSEEAKSNPLNAKKEPPRFTTSSVGENVQRVLPIDWDVDLDVDLAVVDADSNLTIWQNDAAELGDEPKWSKNATLNLGFQPTGMLVADLFMVDSSHRERIKIVRAGLSEDENDDEKSDATADARSSLFSLKDRHDIFPGIIAFSDEGVKLIAVDAREATDATNRLSFVEDKSGLESLKNVHAVTTGDMEGDGDLDLIISDDTGMHVFINRGDRTFFESKPPSGTFDSDDPVTAMAIADLDRDLDLDVVTLHAKSGKIGLLENLLHLQFRTRYLDEIPPIENAHSVAVEDVDGNVAWDVLVVGKNQSQVIFAHTANAGVWTVDRVETGKGVFGNIAVADFDNDSFTDIVGGGMIAHAGPWGLTDPVPVESITNSPVLASDINADGKMDLVSVSDQKATIALNQTSSAGHHLAVRFKGIADNAASSGRVNHFAIGSVLELRFGPHYRAKIVTSPSTHFGINDVANADAIRVIMPNGLTQSIREPNMDSVIEEEQSLKGSCPYIYCWDGEKFSFATDCLWAAPLGLQVAPGVVVKDRPWEYLKLNGDLIKPKDGQYELRITEELWEVAYFDHVSLMAVDHPADTEIWTNEKVGPPDLAKPRIYAFSDSDYRPIQSAVDTIGRDVTALLSQSDGRYVQGFDRRIRQGLCPPHWIEAAFDAADLASGDGTDEKRVFLVLRGWILPTDTSLNIQIDQNPELPPIEFPSLWTPDENREWKKSIASIGFPGGKTKTIVVDVTDAMNADDLRFRVRTSAQIYWDSARLAVQSSEPDFKTSELALMNAEVAAHGFSAKSQANSRSPEVYDYQNASLQPRWPPLRGNVTQYGPCRELLDAWDDEMVVISGGDEIRLRFELPKTELPKGWRRDFVLHSVGWDKDADLNTLTGQRIDPLPIRDMTAYPPTMKTAPLFDNVLEKNANHLRRQQSFRAFWYRPGTEPKAFLDAGL